MLLFWFLSTAVREDSSAFFAFTSYGHSKQKKSHGKPRVPTVGNDRISEEADYASFTVAL